MIRFCDSDVGYVEYNLLSRSKLLSYFLSGHLEEIVCVGDGSDEEVFVGIMTYSSLLRAVSLDSAIIREYVILDQDIWENARAIFKKRGRDIREDIPLPVLNKDYQLICFAYQDDDANREIRMLRELKEAKGVLQFSDVFPAYKCVKIHEFNELAFFLADYLIDQNISVQVDGVMWQDFFTNGECQAPEYECLHIYAEGTWERTHNWKENLLRSVSVEFECVDKVYEANIKSGFIDNTGGEEYDKLLERLRGEKEVIICGIGMEAQDTYDFLLGNGIEVCCFVVNKLHSGCMHRLLGKKIISLSEAIDIYRNPVFIDGVSKYSAWGLGSVDYYDYVGYKRNERYILLKDYIEVPQNNLLNILKNTGVVLAGDWLLCGRLYEYLMRNAIPVTGYLHTLEEDLQPENVPEVTVDIIDRDNVCIIVEPMCWSDVKGRVIGQEEKGQRIVYLREKNIDNYTDYFSDIIPFINIEKDNCIKYKNECFKPKRIVLGSIMLCAGNHLFRSLLDSHPHVLHIRRYVYFNNWLFWICVRLSMERAENILSLFWKIMDGDEECFVDKMAFVGKMEQLLARDSRFTSQELFVIFQIAYMYMFRKDVSEDQMRSMIIYWDPHYLPRDKVEECVKWLGTEEIHCDIINIVRNSVPIKGALLKTPSYIKMGVKCAYNVVVLMRMPIEKKKYKQSGRVVVKFEDLKCNPKERMEEICDRWDMEWSDTLLQTTLNGKPFGYYNYIRGISGFDLEPVYNTYENFFSEFDRLKLMLLDAPWRKKYGYPYVGPDQFTRKELQEMFLKEFKFENPGDTTGFYKDRLDLDDRIALQNIFRCRMQETRCVLSLWEGIFLEEPNLC